MLSKFIGTEQAHVVQEIIPRLKRYSELLTASITEQAHADESHIYEEPLSSGSKSNKVTRSPSVLSETAVLRNMNKFTGQRATNALTNLIKDKIYWKRSHVSGDRDPILVITLRANLHLHGQLENYIPSSATDVAFIYLHDTFALLEDSHVYVNDITITPLTQYVLYTMLASAGFDSSNSPVSVYYLTTNPRYKHRIRLLHKCGVFQDLQLVIPLPVVARVYHDHVLTLLKDEYINKYMYNPESRGFDRRHQIIKLAVTLTSTQKDALVKSHKLEHTVSATSDLFYDQCGVYDMSSPIHTILEFSPHLAYYMKIFESSVLQSIVNYIGSYVPLGRTIHHTSRNCEPLILQWMFVR